MRLWSDKCLWIEWQIFFFCLPQFPLELLHLKPKLSSPCPQELENSIWASHPSNASPAPSSPPWKLRMCNWKLAENLVVDAAGRWCWKQDGLHVPLQCQAWLEEQRSRFDSSLSVWCKERAVTKAHLQQPCLHRLPSSQSRPLRIQQKLSKSTSEKSSSFTPKEGVNLWWWPLGTYLYVVSINSMRKS